MDYTADGIHRNITEYVDSLKNLAVWAQTVARDDRAKTLPSQSDDYAKFWDDIASILASAVSALELETERYRVSINRKCSGIFHINHTNQRCRLNPGHEGFHETYWHDELIQWGMSV